MSTEWPLRTIGDLVTLQRGIDLPDSQRNPGSIPVMGSFGITGRHDTAACKGPGVTVGRSGASIGTVAYIAEDYWPLNTCLYVRDFHGNNPLFCYYFLKTIDLAAHNSGSAQPSLNRNYVHPLPVRFPDRLEQDEIAATLGALDDKIELNRKMNATLEAMARALFRDWFVDFGPTRTKMAGAEPYLSPDLWPLFPDRLDAEGKPEGWKFGTIANCTKSIFSGGTPQTTKPSYWGGHIPWLSSGETRNLVVLETERTITEEGVKNSSTRFAPKGSTVIASAGQGNTRGQASLLSREMYINQSVIAAVADEQITSATHLFLDLSRRYEELRQISDSNSSRGSLTTKMVAALTTVIAPKPIVAAFEGIAGPIMDRIVQNESESRTLAQTRDLLLPRLMSGELRVADLAPAERGTAA